MLETAVTRKSASPIFNKLLIPFYSDCGCGYPLAGMGTPDANKREGGVMFRHCYAGVLFMDEPLQPKQRAFFPELVGTGP